MKKNDKPIKTRKKSPAGGARKAKTEAPAAKAAVREAAPYVPQEACCSAASPDLQIAVEDSKYFTGHAPKETWGMPTELPGEYGSEYITLMVRDPYWAYTYWEVTPRRLDDVRMGLGQAGHDAFLALRLYDVTDVNFDGTNAHRFFDIGVYERVGNWYLNPDMPGRAMVVDLGLKTADGRFVTLARSNVVSAPRDGVSDVLDEEWVIGEEEFMRIFALSGGYGVGRSSADVRLAAGGRLPFGVASPGMGSLALMSPMKKRERGFWFVLNAELIVYGATEPDAKVTLQGKPVALRPDGTFTMRFALPDGTQVIPVSATSADEVETRWITPTVSRKTN